MVRNSFLWKRKPAGVRKYIFFIQISTKKNEPILFSYSYALSGTDRNLRINLSKEIYISYLEN